jgi:cytochrome d ubiquinol oxidase subunit I
MDTETLSRIQFAATIAFHYFYPPISIGLGLLLVGMEGLYLKTGDKIWHQMAHFWTRVFGLVFAMGVATGIVMEFQFGTNWATYSRFVGDVFGSALAAEGIFAFMLEAGFLSILLFGWNRVSKQVHFFATCMVCLGAHFSAIWIVVANSWMQTPAGFHLEIRGERFPADYPLRAEDIPHARAVIDDFWAMVFNPSSVDRLTHTVLGCWLTGAFLVASVSAYYYLRHRHLEVARRGLLLSLPFAAAVSILQFASAHSTAKGVAVNQPAKLAAMEGIYATEPRAPMTLLGWVDEKNERTLGLKIPGMLSFLAHGDMEKPVKGLQEFAPQDRPKVQAVFQLFHLMVGCAFVMAGLAFLGTGLLWRDRLFDRRFLLSRWLLLALVPAVLLPHIAGQAGWFVAELGRQPWIVYGLLRTSQGFSEVVSANQVLTSLILFTLVYALLFALFLYLLNRKIHHGPDEAYLPQPEGGVPARMNA